MGKSSERFPERQYVRQTGARRAFDVVEAQHEEEVIAIVANEWGVAGGTTHPLDARMVAGQPEVRPVGPAGRLWLYSLDYAVPAGAVLPGNPLDLPPVILWEPGFAAEAIDRDVYNNPILNSAGDAPATPILEEFPTMQLSVTRWETRYDVQKFFAYRNRVNSDRFVIFNTWVVEPGQCRVVGYHPAEAFDLGAPYVRVTYRFEFLEGEQRDADGLFDGFKRRFLDQGRMGWRQAQSQGDQADHLALWDKTGQPVATDQRLDGYGRPLDPSITVAGSAGVSNPKPLPDQVVRQDTEDATYLKYQTKRTAPLAAIFN